MTLHTLPGTMCTVASASGKEGGSFCLFVEAPLRQSMSNGSYMSGSSGAAGNTDQTADASPPRIVSLIQNHITISDFTRTVHP